MSINYNFKNTKFCINGEEIPCEIKSVNITEGLDDISDVDDFGLHFNSNEEATLTVKTKLTNVQAWKIIGEWDKLRWYQKLWIRFTDWFGR